MENYFDTIKNRFVKQHPTMIDLIEDVIQNAQQLEKLMLLETEKTE